MSDPILQGHKTIAHKLCNVCTDAALDVWGIKLNTSIFVFPSVLEKMKVLWKPSVLKENKAFP